MKLISILPIKQVTTKRTAIGWSRYWQMAFEGTLTSPWKDILPWLQIADARAWKDEVMRVSSLNVEIDSL